ncbi:hypothetical protein HG263_05490 [Pseudoalteromonas sp. JBTF-M23]|uniref:Uncharacterized protein n=1 Tax=Pseudoalteromonas caenipelagi TaxID=2726988 RepID=A0A849V8U5_9GAMM|nr:hypothetical protein [Pseudoalteromonas caenipelagi]NOU49989.1 hypothetical protein [Pseudoalteromonas caenipelagi]
MALTLLLEPDNWADERDGLAMLDNLYSQNQITDSQLKRLANQLKSKALLYISKEELSQRPELNHFWWYQPWERITD